MIERMHRTLREELDGEALTNLLEAERVFARVVGRYNEQRLHSALGFLTPADYYRGNPSARYAAPTHEAGAGAAPTEGEEPRADAGRPCSC